LPSPEKCVSIPLRLHNNNKIQCIILQIVAGVHNSFWSITVIPNELIIY
jgi:hypothetical protein